MSNRPCNYCALDIITQRAKKEGKIIFVRGGATVLSPNGVYIHKLYEGEELDLRSWDEGNKQIVCWFMELPDHCVC